MTLKEFMAQHPTPSTNDFLEAVSLFGAEEVAKISHGHTLERANICPDCLGSLRDDTGSYSMADLGGRYIEPVCNRCKAKREATTNEQRRNTTKTRRNKADNDNMADEPRCDRV